VCANWIGGGRGVAAARIRAGLSQCFSTGVPPRFELKYCSFSTASRPALGPTQPPIQWVPGVKRPRREDGHSPPSSSEVRNAWSYTCITPYVFMVWRFVKHRVRLHVLTVKHRDNLTLVLYGCETWFVTLKDKHKLMVFENRVLRRIFGPKREEVAGGWRRLHTGGPHNSCASPYFITVTKSMRMRWEEHVSRMGDREMRKIVWLLNLKGRDSFEDLGVNGKIILDWILGK